VKKKHPKDMTTDEAVRHLFPTPVHRHLKKVAHSEEKGPGSKGRNTKRQSRPTR